MTDRDVLILACLITQYGDSEDAAALERIKTALVEGQKTPTNKQSDAIALWCDKRRFLSICSDNSVNDKVASRIYDAVIAQQRTL